MITAIVAGLIAAVFAVMLLLGRFAPKVPASFVAIVVVTAAVLLLKIPADDIGGIPPGHCPRWIRNSSGRLPGRPSRSPH